MSFLLILGYPMAKILVLHGPNLNLLGSREIAIYGHLTLDSINTELSALARELGHKIEHTQSNHEGILIDRLHAAFKEHTDFIIFNPGGFTHTSIALRDALLAIQIPFIEVHISNIFKREAFRHHSYFSEIAIGTITGLGMQSYLLALKYAHDFLKTDIKKQEH